MQLTASGGPRLRAAACLLLAAGAGGAGAAHAQSAAPVAVPSAAKWQFEGSTLIYGEQQRAFVGEPVARITRLFESGQQFSLEAALDVITGASPTGAQPSGVTTTQTTTSASGSSSSTSQANQLPTTPFHDMRGALDLGWVRPIGPLAFTTGGHLSHEKDYSSTGANETVALDLDHHLLTLTAGAGFHHDKVFPVGGVRVPFDSLGLTGETERRKNDDDVVLGISRVLTRRMLLGITGSRTREDGYLTEPYKVVSILNLDANDPGGALVGQPVAYLHEKRPSARDRRDVLVSTVYHLPDDVVYLSYRYYWDDWGVRSSTVDLKYHYDLPAGDYVVPHVRVYVQTPADFYSYGLPRGAPLPEYASSDTRLGPLHSVTLGCTYGFKLPGQPGDITVRGEYIRQWGDGHPAAAIGVQQTMDMSAGLNIVDLTAGYTVQF